jgi:hypothetical protein
MDFDFILIVDPTPGTQFSPAWKSCKGSHAASGFTSPDVVLTSVPAVAADSVDEQPVSASAPVTSSVVMIVCVRT